MVTDLPKITIITPSYNQGHYIEETIQSVVNQEYPNLEYIVMDGGSTDNTVEILKRYDGDIKWFSEKDNGQSDALNKGLRMATGDIVAFINSDDYYEPNSLLTIGHLFTKSPKVDWVTGRCHNIDQSGKKIRRFIGLYKDFWLNLKSYKVLLVLNYISQPATFWRKEVLEKIGFFDEGLHYSMDYDYWLRVGKEYRLHFVNKYLANFRIHPTSKAGSSARGQFDASLEIAKSYTTSPFLLSLHKFHLAITVSVYEHLLAKEHA